MGSTIIFVVDRLGAGHLGPYGNTWLETPHFNRLAAQSLVCETVFADSPDLATACRGYWTGRHVLEPEAGRVATLPILAAERGIRTLLITDDELVANHPLAAEFGECELVAAPAEARAAEQLEQTALFRLMTAALEALSREAGPQLTWIHARGMAGAWDAPREYREQLADPDDPAPPDFLKPPELRLPRHVDPDEVLGIVQAYAGQVQVLDQCLGLLLDALDQRNDRDELLFAVTSPRGYPLGEHGRIGPCDGALYSELLQVPLLVQLPQRAGRSLRTQRLVQPCDLFATIVESCGWGELSAAQHAASLLRAVHGDESPPRQAACAYAPHQRAIRTPAWLLRESQDESGLRQELFAKPDDRWEANEVSSRCGEVPALLAAELDRHEQAAAAGQLAGLAPLPEMLMDVWH